MILNYSQFDKDIPTIVLMSHGMFASALVDSAKMIAGDLENVAYACLQEGDNPQDFKDEVKKMLDELPENRVVLVDLFGGTPCNAFLATLKDHVEKEEAVAGMNLGMLLELLGSRNSMDRKQLIELALNCGKESVCNVTQKIFG